jgi:hypothetical protein
MFSTIKKLQLLTGFLILAVCLASGCASWFFGKMKWAQNRLDNERVHAEYLLSEKLRAEKQAEKALKKQAILETDILNLNQELDENSSFSSRLYSKFSRLKKDFEKAKSKNERLQQMALNQNETYLDREKIELRMKHILSQNDLLTAQNDSITNLYNSLGQNYQTLEKQLQLAQVHSPENLRVEVLEKNSSKITTQANRARTFQISFDCPKSIANKLSFNIENPEGKSLSNNQIGLGAIEIQPLASYEFLASNDSNQHKIELIQKVKLEYVPNVKLLPGLYTIRIAASDKNMGSYQIRLL